MLPETFPGFVEPSRNSMARYCLNSVKEIRQASRMLLQGIVERMTNDMRQCLLNKWKERFCINTNIQLFTNTNISAISSIHPSAVHTLHSLQKTQSLNLRKNHNSSMQQRQMTPTVMSSNVNNSLTLSSYTSGHSPPPPSLILSRNGRVPLSVLLGAIVICIIHSLKHNIVEDVVASSVMNTLIQVLMETVHHNSDMVKMSLACDYLAKVIVSWFSYVYDVTHLLKILLDLRNCDYPLLKSSASKALLQSGVAIPQSFVKTMGNEALLISKRKRHEQALMCIVNLVQKYPQVLLKHIPLTVSCIIRCLDPSAPRRRKALLHSTTASLHVLVQKYPNVAFHQQTQHFAIGTGPARDNCILIYDLRTTTRWRQLKGHTAAVTAIEFNADGNYITSYSAYERPPTVRCWYIGTGGFFNALVNIGSASHNGKCVKTCPMPSLDHLYPPIDHLSNTKLTWNPRLKGAVKLVRENQSVLFFTVLHR